MAITGAHGPLTLRDAHHPARLAAHQQGRPVTARRPRRHEPDRFHVGEAGRVDELAAKAGLRLLQLGGAGPVQRRVLLTTGVQLEHRGGGDAVRGTRGDDPLDLEASVPGWQRHAAGQR